MPTFPSLPSEIKFEVLSHIYLQDLKNFAQTNRSFHTLSQRAEYRQLISNHIRDRQNRCNIYGTIDTSDNFRIFEKYNVSNPRQIRRGRLAMTFEKSTLVEYMWKLYVPINQNLANINIDQIRSLNIMNNVNMEPFTNYKIKYFYYWLTSTDRKQLCDILQQHLISIDHMTHT